MTPNAVVGSSSANEKRKKTIIKNEMRALMLSQVAIVPRRRKLR